MAHSTRTCTWDHPRVCGEKNSPTANAAGRAGSPPRVRGKVMDTKPLCSWSRITPACAGKRTFTSGRPVRTRDHPRVCGEKHGSLVCCVAHAGSPPRVRGKAFSGFFGAVFVGITPACAGKSYKPGKNPYTGGDHPRVCGEKFLGSSLAFQVLGSPPRVRGKD